MVDNTEVVKMRDAIWHVLGESGEIIAAAGNDQGRCFLPGQQAKKGNLVKIHRPTSWKIGKD